MSISKLLEIGLLSEGDEIVWNRRFRDKAYKAVVLKNGDLLLEDGKIYSSPSGAAKALNQGRPVDGWLAWRLLRTNERLASIRERAYEKMIRDESTQ